jgi:hypothetical protein
MIQDKPAVEKTREMAANQGDIDNRAALDEGGKPPCSGAPLVHSLLRFKNRPLHVMKIHPFDGLFDGL